MLLHYFYTSGFKKTWFLILIVDGNGSDLETTSYFEGNNFKINLIENFKYYGLKHYTMLYLLVFLTWEQEEKEKLWDWPHMEKNIEI